MSQYVPGAGAHAVEQAVVGIRLFEPCDPASYDNALAIAAALPELPARIQLDAMAMAFGRQVISHGYHVPTQLEPGMLFSRIRPDGGTEEELTVERGAVTYRTNNYKRWTDVQKIISDVICPMADCMTGGDLSKISVVELRCIDRFDGLGDDPLCLKSLVKQNSRVIPSAYLEKDEMLHIHCGWFQNKSENGRYLVNFNLDIVEYPPNRKANLLQVVSAQSSQVGNIFSKKEGFSESILAVFDELHAIDKSLLAEILNEDMQKSISLAGDTGISAL